MRMSIAGAKLRLRNIQLRRASEIKERERKREKEKELVRIVFEIFFIFGN